MDDTCEACGREMDGNLLLAWHQEGSTTYWLCFNCIEEL